MSGAVPPPFPRALLTRGCDGTALGPLLIPREEWRYYPAASDRGAWEGLSTGLRRGIVGAAEEWLGKPWEAVRATDLLAFTRSGRLLFYEAPQTARRQRLGAALLAECVEAKGRFLDEIADAAWLICEETYWGSTGHLFMQRRGPGLPDVAEPTVDLGVGETAALLAWTHHLLGGRLDAVSPLVGERIGIEVDRRVLTPCLERDDFWWMGWHRDNRPVNNWNPWCCSNWLLCALILEKDPARRIRAVHKVMRILDSFIDHSPGDGGCDEGSTYWARAAGSLLECLEMLRSATAGKIDIFGEPVIREMGRFAVRSHVSGPWFVNFADGPARSTAEPIIIHLFGLRIGDPDLASLGAWLFQGQGMAPVAGSLGRVLPGLFLDAGIRRSPCAAPLLRDVWLPDLQVMAARDAAGSAEGLYVAAKGGHNEESHNHNDCGSLLAYLDGWPLLIDTGAATYSSRTFDMKERYKIWTMQSQWHNLPTVNGTLQSAGRGFAARNARHEATDEMASLQLDLEAAWPAEAGIERWNRTIRLNRGRDLVVTDDYRLASAAKPVEFNFITTRPVDVTVPGEVRLGTCPGDGAGRGATLAYDAAALVPEVDAVTVDDPQLSRIWGDRIFRLRLVERAAAAGARREFRLTPAPLRPGSV